MSEQLLADERAEGSRKCGVTWCRSDAYPGSEWCQLHEVVNPFEDSTRDDEWDGEGLEGDDELSNCHAFVDGGVFVCGAAGSEDCDQCPFNCELGTKAEYEPEEEPDDPIP